jgi:hypothetical protein
MILSVLKSANRFNQSLVVAFALCGAAVPAVCQKKPKDQLEKPMAGPRATPLRVTILYVSPDTASQKVDRVQIGREMVVSEKNGDWLRVYANTDIEELQDKDAPEFGRNETPPPISGWMQSKGVVVETNPNGDQILMGEAANQETLAEDPKGPISAPQSARLLYRRLTEMYPNSPLVPEAAWRSADVQWQIQRHDAASRPSAHEKEAYMRAQMDEDDLKKVIKDFPKTRQAALAGYELIENKLCGDWQGTVKCPENEVEVYEKYLAEFPDGPRTAQAMYQVVFREASLVDMYAADGNQKKSDQAKARARDVAARLKEKFPQTDSCWKAGALVYKLDEGIPVYGIDLQ